MSDTLNAPARTSVLQRPSQITNRPGGATITAPSLSWLTSLTAPNSGVDLGVNIGTPVATAPVQVPDVYANARVPSSQTQVPDVYAHAQVPNLQTQAQNYRLQHGLATSDDTDALNAESLAAAQAGRTSFNPTLAAQYGQPLAAGVSGPRTDVVNALSLPPSTAQTQQQPVQTAQNNLLQQGIY